MNKAKILALTSALILSASAFAQTAPGTDANNTDANGNISGNPGTSSNSAASGTNFNKSDAETNKPMDPTMQDYTGSASDGTVNARDEKEWKLRNKANRNANGVNEVLPTKGNGRQSSETTSTGR